MKRILSFANKPKLERQEKPNSARVKKKIPASQRQQMPSAHDAISISPSRFWNPGISFVTLCTKSPQITSKCMD